MIPSCSTVAIKKAAGGGGGGGSPTITLSNASPSKSGTGSQTAAYSVNSDGTVKLNGSATVFENWISDATKAGNYQVRATFVSGNTLSSGTLGTWMTLTSNRFWNLTNAASNDTTLSTVLTVEIRDTATSTVRATATITISATSTSIL